MKNKKIGIIVAFLLVQSVYVYACPLCLLGLYEYHIANFGRMIMNMLPLLAPLLTAIALYWKTIVRKVFHGHGHHCQCQHCQCTHHEEKKAERGGTVPVWEGHK